ncbi:MAG: hypothetical protein QOD45_903, partial [Pseudonocardiales bacterium]|nr:hypothetical protein [Pseudonocardiales bacterium]
VTFDDCGHSIVANLSEIEARSLAASLPVGPNLGLLLGVTQRAALERRRS